MKTTRIAFASVVLAAVLSSCAGPDAAAPAAAAAGASASSAAAPAEATPSVTTGPEAEVETAFRAYYTALLARDFTAACALNAPETNTVLIDSLKAQGVTVGTCEEAFSTVYAIPGASDAADRIANSAQVQGVTIDGDNATVSWSAEAQGERRTVDSGLRRVDGRWLLLSAAP